jgi:hypothetical protein
MPSQAQFATASRRTTASTSWVLLVQLLI